MTTRRIVAVDDEESILKVVRYALEQDGFEVHTAGDAEGGAFLVGEVDPDLVIRCKLHGIAMVFPAVPLDGLHHR